MIEKERTNSMQAVAIVNGRALTPYRTIDDAVIVIVDGIITEVGKKGDVTPPPGAQTIDAHGHYVTPGFIETHVHGGGGGDVMSGNPGDILQMARAHAQGGVTAMMPTTVTAPKDAIVRALEAVEEAMAQPNPHGATVVGAHLEGPYLHVRQAGAQNPAYLKHPDIDETMAIVERFPFVQRVSLAPELPGGLELGRALTRRNIVASIAHSDATYNEIVQAVEWGFTHATHMYSGMSQMTRSDGYRIAGVVESVLALPELTTELIADGHHIPPSMLRMAVAAKGIQHLCLTTDATRKAGTGAGKDELFGLPVVVEAERAPAFELPTTAGDYVAKLADRSAFAGSVATMDKLLRTITSPYVGVALPDAVKMVTTIPARIHGLHRERGTLSPGMIGDAVIIDEQLRVQKTIVGGRIVYASPSVPSHGVD